MSVLEHQVSETMTPADQAAVAEAVRDAAGCGLAVYPFGGGTMLDCGIRPTRPGISLSLTKLNRVIDYPAADLTITVEAGMTIGELNKRLAAQGQRLPVDVPQPDRATIGGAIAVNAAGPRRHAFGTMRDYLLGFTAVDGTGMTFSGGGRVVKNAAGYNMCRLMAGSLGTLGVLTQATLLVRPVCEAAALLACDLPTFDLAEKLLASLTHSPVRPAAVELSAGSEKTGTGSEPQLSGAQRSVTGEVPVPVFSRGPNPLFGPMQDGNVARLYVGFEGAATEVEWMLGRLRQDWTALGMTSPMLMPNLANEKLWRWIAEFPADVEIGVLPGKIVATVAELLNKVPGCSIHAHAGDGVICVGLREEEGSGFRVRGSESVPRSEAPALERTSRGAVPKPEFGNEGPIHPSSFILHPSALRAIAAAAGGKLTVLRCPDGVALSRDDVWGTHGPEIVVMEAIKERFDPHHILNPGRFVY
jgi:glycolate oxidase FAD binding subunit